MMPTEPRCSPAPQALLLAPAGRVDGSGLLETLGFGQPGVELGEAHVREYGSGGRRGLDVAAPNGPCRLWIRQRIRTSYPPFQAVP